MPSHAASYWAVPCRSVHSVSSCAVPLLAVSCGVTGRVVPFCRSVPFLAVSINGPCRTVLSFRAVSSRVVSYNGPCRTVLSFRVVPCRVVSYNGPYRTVLSFRVVPCRVVSYNGPYRTVLPFRAVSCRVVSYNGPCRTVLSFRAVPYSVVPYRAVPRRAEPCCTVPSRAVYTGPGRTVLTWISWGSLSIRSLAVLTAAEALSNVDQTNCRHPGQPPLARRSLAARPARVALPSSSNQSQKACRVRVCF